MIGMTTKYTAYDYGEAILVDGVPYIRQGSEPVAAAVDLTLDADTDFADIGDRDPGNEFSNSGVIFTVDNTAPFSVSWTLEQCAIACGVAAHSSYRWADNAQWENISEENQPYAFFTAPSSGELRLWTPSPPLDGFAVGVNSLIVVKSISSSSNNGLHESKALRVNAGDVVYMSTKTDSGVLVAHSNPSGSDGISWAFLPDEYP